MSATIEVKSREVDPNGMTFFAPTAGATESTRLWAATHLADLPTRLIFNTEHPVKFFTDPEGGEHFRRAFSIVADPEGKREFRLYLNAGATLYDLERARHMIESAKAGWFHPDIWERREEPGNWFNSHYWRTDPSRKGIRYEWSREVRPCVLDACIEEYHLYVDGEFDDAHRAEKVEHPDGWYFIHISNYEEEGGWHTWASIDNDLPDGREGIAIVQRLVEEQTRLQERCDELNAAAKAVER